MASKAAKPDTSPLNPQRSPSASVPPVASELDQTAGVDSLVAAVAVGVVDAEGYRRLGKASDDARATQGSETPPKAMLGLLC